MTESKHGDLIDCLRSHAGDDFVFLVRFTADCSDILVGEEWFDEFVAENDTRSPEDMHRDAVYRLEQATVGGRLYGNEMSAEVQVTEKGLGVYLYPSDDTGYFGWIDDGAAVELPALTDDCMDALGVDESASDGR